MAIQTSQITTAANGDLTIDPNGTGKIVLTKLAGGGELPLGAADSDGNVHSFDHSQLTELPGGATDGDLIMVQRGGEYYSIDATALGGIPLLDPDPRPSGEITFNPAPQGGTGTKDDPFVLSEVICPTPGGSVESNEVCTITTTERCPALLPMYDQSEGDAKGRFVQDWVLVDATQTASFRLKYFDTPDTSVGQPYTGTIKMGSGSVYVTFPVVQIANKTVFDPAVNASPPSVEIPSENLYGTGEAIWADGATTLSVTDSGLPGTYSSAIEFSVNGGSFDTIPKSVSDGDQVKVIFKETSVAAAAEDAIISGALTNNAGYFQPFSMVKHTQANSFTIAPLVDQPLNTAVATGNGKATGINAQTTVSGVGSSANQLTALAVSINGETPVAATNVTYNPGDEILAYGTTGASSLTTYQATFTLGGASAPWDVTTADVGAEIVQPQITSPSYGAENLAPDVILQGSAYTPTDPANPPGPHTSSTWEVYEADLGVTCETSLIQSVNDGTIGNYDAVGFINHGPAFTEEGKNWVDVNDPSTGWSWDSGTSMGTNIPVGSSVTSNFNSTFRIFRDTENDGSSGLKVGVVTPYSGEDRGHRVWGSPDGTAGSWIDLGIYSNTEIGNGVEVKYPYAALAVADGGVMTVASYAVVGSETRTELTFPNDDGFDCFADGDVVQGGGDDGTGVVYQMSASYNTGSGAQLLNPSNLPDTTNSHPPFTNGLLSVPYGDNPPGVPPTGPGINHQIHYYEFDRPFRPTFGYYDPDDESGTSSSNATWNHVLAYWDEASGNWIIDAVSGKALGNGSSLVANSRHTQWIATRLITSYGVGDQLGTTTSGGASPGADDFGAQFTTYYFIIGTSVSDAAKIVGDPDSATNKIVVDGGNWIGTDGTTSGTAPQDNKLSKFIEGALPGAPTTEPPDTNVYTAVTPSVTTLTTATLDKTNLNESKAYYSRVKYADDSSTGALVESEFSPYNEFLTEDEFEPEAGEEVGGGYFCGQINDGGTIYNLILAPNEWNGLQGTFGGKSPVPTQMKNDRSGPEPGAAQAQNATYGGTATLYFAGIGAMYPASNWCINTATGPNAGTYDASNATGTGINGYNDWYIPAKNELACVYFAVGSQGSNSGGSGSNPDSVEPYTPNTNYGPDFPAAQTDPQWMPGGENYFYGIGGGTDSVYYLTNTEDSSNTANSWKQYFSSKNGGIQQSDFKNGSGLAARAIRRFPA